MERTCCVQNVLNVGNNLCTQHVLLKFELGIFMYWTCNAMNNLSSYCGLVDAKKGASDKDLPVKQYGLSLVTTKITRSSLILFPISISSHEKYASCFRGLSFCVGGRCDLEPLLLAHYIQWKIWQVFYESVLKVCYFHSPGKLHYTVWQYGLESF